MSRNRLGAGIGLLLLALLAPLLPAAPGPLAATPAEAARTFGDDPLDDVLHWAAQERRCGLTTNKLAALMLAPTFPETGAPGGQAPSPMTLSRWDNQPGLHSFRTVAGEPRAFWHPGVGMWQFDSAGLGAPFSAAQRIDTFVVAARTAATMAARWCTSPTLAYVWAPWYGCGSTTCRDIYQSIYRPGTDRLVGVGRDAGVGARGGMQRRTCSGTARSGTFTCWRVDPARAQGYAGFRAGGFGPAPITAPFFVYAANGREYRHWLASDTGYGRDIWATRPLGSNARTSLTWRRGTALRIVTTSGGGGGGTVGGGAGFTDVALDAWYLEALEWAVGGGTVTGYDDQTFRPGEAVTRGQAVAWIWSLAGRPTPTGTLAFSDVDAGHWYADALRWAVTEGVVTGFPDGTFRGRDDVNRAQLASMLWNWADRPVAAAATPFSDVDAAAWYAPAVAWLAEVGYATGFPNGTFRPAEPVKRAQGVAWLHAARPFTDVAPGAWYAPSVDWGRFRRVVEGHEDHTFRGEEPTTRRAAVDMVWAFVDRPPGTGPHGLTDVAPDDPAVTWAVGAGVVSGFPDATFRPGEPLNRAQAVMVLWGAAGRRAAGSAVTFGDVSPTAWYAEGLAWAAEHGIVVGYPDGTFRPAEPVSRAQLATQLHALATTPAAWGTGVPVPRTARSG